MAIAMISTSATELRHVAEALAWMVRQWLMAHHVAEAVHAAADRAA